MRKSDLSLRGRIRDAFQYHTEKDQGMIAGPDRLLERTLDAVRDWLVSEQNCHEAEGLAERAEALRDLRDNLIG